MNNKYVKALGCLILLALYSSIVYLMYTDVLSLMLMADEITFSATVVFGILTFPFMFYCLLGSAFFFIFGELPKHNKVTVKYLTILMMSSFLLGPPISIYVDYKLKNHGYLVCDRISWMSPTTYVRDLSLC